MAQYNIGGSNQATGNITNDDEGCSGETVTIAAGVINGSETYSWSDGSIGDNQTFDRSFTFNNTFTVTITDGIETETQTINVVINASPTPNITATENTGTANDGVICSGDNVTLDSGIAGATAYAWSDGGGTNQTATYTNITSNTTYTVTVTNSGGCTGSDEFEVTVDTPTATSITFDEDAGTADDGNVCAGDTGIGIIAPSGFSVYAWSSVGGSSQSFTHVAGAAGTEIFTVTVTNSNGCTATAENVLTVNGLPVTPSITVAETSGSADNDGTICNGEEAILDAGSYDAYLWSESNATTQTISVTAGGTYTVTVSNTDGCSATDEIIITGNPSPTAAIAVTETSGGTDNDAELCNGDSATLDAGTHTSYIWSQGNATTQTISVNTSGTYTVTVTSANGCTDTAEQGVTAHALPVPLATSNSAICSGEDLNLMETGTGATAWAWSGPNSFTSTLQNPIISAAMTSADGDYYVTVTNAAACTSTSSIAVTVKGIPTAIANSNSAICAEEDLDLMETGTGATAWAWSGPNSFTSTLQNPTISAATTSADGDYFVTVTNAEACTGTSSIAVTV
ncbi:MAG: hypothetical protein AB8B69_22140, partial [Chitinophagales bacterium]